MLSYIYIHIYFIYNIYFLHLIMVDNKFHNDPTICNDPANLYYNVDLVSPYMSMNESVN